MAESNGLFLLRPPRLSQMYYNNNNFWTQFRKSCENVQNSPLKCSRSPLLSRLYGNSQISVETLRELHRSKLWAIKTFYMSNFILEKCLWSSWFGPPRGNSRSVNVRAKRTTRSFRITLARALEQWSRQRHSGGRVDCFRDSFSVRARSGALGRRRRRSPLCFVVARPPQ